MTMEYSNRVVGKLYVNRGDDCACCKPKKHAFSFGVRIPAYRRPYSPLECNTAHEWLHDIVFAWLYDHRGEDDAVVEISVKISSPDAGDPRGGHPRGALESTEDRFRRGADTAGA